MLEADLREFSYPVPFAFSPLLPLLLASLSVQKHTPKTATRVQDEYDYIIVGAGSAGSVLASRLSEVPCVSILLLEAGKPPPIVSDVPAISRSFINSDIDWKYKTAPQANTGFGLINRQVAWPSGKTLGGSSVLNAMFAIRGNEQNYDGWATLGAQGWSYNDVFPYFTKLEDNQDPEFANNGYHGVGGPQTIHKPRHQSELRGPLMQAAEELGYGFVDVNGPLQTGFYDHQSTLRNGQRCSTAKSYLVPAENRTNLDILSEAMARRVLFEDNVAYGVEFDFAGKTRKVRAKREVILSAGTTNTAQLLMLSGIGPKEELRRFNIPVLSDLHVGKNLQDHPGVPMSFFLGDQVIPVNRKLNQTENIQQYIDDRTGPLAITEGCALVGLLSNEGPEPDTGFPDHELYFLEASAYIPKHQLNLKPELYERVFTPYQEKPLFFCISQILNPKSRGEVRLQSADPYDPPIIDPRFFEDPEDVEDAVHGLKTCLKMGTSQPMQKLGSQPFQTVYPGCEQYVEDQDEMLRCMVRTVIITLNHQVGTAKMGDPQDPTTVVDPLLRVKTVDRLRVVDASVMPIIPSGNTNLPTIMVAEKAADIIKATIDCQKSPEDTNLNKPAPSAQMSPGETDLDEPAPSDEMSPGETDLDEPAPSDEMSPGETDLDEPAPSDEMSPGETDLDEPAPSDQMSPGETDLDEPAPSDEISPGETDLDEPAPSDEMSPGETDLDEPAPSDQMSPGETDLDEPAPSDEMSPGETDLDEPAPSDQISPGETDLDEPAPSDEMSPGETDLDEPAPSDQISPGETNLNKPAPSDQMSPGVTNLDKRAPPAQKTPCCRRTQSNRPSTSFKPAPPAQKSPGVTNLRKPAPPVQKWPGVTNLRKPAPPTHKWPEVTNFNNPAPPGQKTPCCRKTQSDQPSTGLRPHTNRRRYPIHSQRPSNPNSKGFAFRWWQTYTFEHGHTQNPLFPIRSFGSSDLGLSWRPLGTSESSNRPLSPGSQKTTWNLSQQPLTPSFHQPFTPSVHQDRNVDKVKLCRTLMDYLECPDGRESKDFKFASELHKSFCS